MATIGGPNITTNGLILNIDAANTKSYTGTGNILTDISGNNNNGTIITDSSYSSDNLGNIIYGINQNSGVITITPITAGLNLSNETYILWAKCNKLRSSVGGGSFSNRIIQYGSYYGNNSGGFGLQSGYISAYLKGSTNNGWSAASSSSTGNTIYDSYNWIHYTIQITNNNNIKFFMNTNLIFNLNIADAYTQYSYNMINIGTNMDMNFSNLQIYNKVLTQSEILQNYNTTKSRFIM